MLLLNWGLAYDCTQQYDLAFEKLNRAAAIQTDAHVLATIGMIHAKQGKRAEAFEVLDKAEKLDSGFDMTFAYRGNLYLLSGEYARAAQEFRRALALNPQNAVAQRGLTTALSAGPQTQ
jgi:tetratricopeptide (TPR) repeat protein